MIMKRILYLALIFLGSFLVTDCSKDDPIPERLEVTINNQELVFNNIFVDRQGSNNSRYFTAVSNNSTGRIINFYANVGDEGSVQNFTYTIRGKVYKQLQDSDFLNTNISLNTNAQFTMTFSGVLSSFNTVTESYETIELTNGFMDVEY